MNFSNIRRFQHAEAGGQSAVADEPGLTPEGAEELAGLAQDIAASLNDQDAPLSVAADPHRDASGRFAANEGAEPAPVTAPAPDPGMAQWAKAQGVSESDLALAKSDRDIQSLVAMQRTRSLEAMGTNPNELVQALQHYRNRAPAEPGSEPAPDEVPPLLDPLALEFNEDEWSEKQLAVLKGLVGHINKVAETVGPRLSKVEQYADTQQKESEQRVQLARQSGEQRTALDAIGKAAEQVPGFVERFGNPVELDRVSKGNPYDANVSRWMGMQAGELEPAYHRRAQMFGPGDQALVWAMRDVMQKYEQSPGATVPVNGVVRQGPSRTPPDETPPDAENLDAKGLFDVVYKAVESEWDNHGGNPMSRTI